MLDQEGGRRTVSWDRLVRAPGSTTRTQPVPGIAEHAKGFKTIAEALYLRDHLLAQLELADATDDPDERAARCTFVVVGAGYTGTEVAAQGQLFTQAALRRYPRIRPDELRWLLVDLAPGVLPDWASASAGQHCASCGPAGWTFDCKPRCWRPVRTPFGSPRNDRARPAPPCAASV